MSEADHGESSVPLRDHLNALDHARERAQDMAASEREKTAAILRTPAETTDVSLRSYLEALRTGDQRALDMASEERAKAAEVLRDEQRRALTVAQEEREKAAQALSAGTDRAIADNFARLSEQFAAYEKHIEAVFAEKDRATRLAADEREEAADALRIGLARAIQEGDERLREHVTNQVQQLREIIASGDRLEVARIAASHNELQARQVASEVLFREIQTAAKEAVTKAEMSQRNVNEGQNEFRQSLNDTTATMMPRKEVEALLVEQGRQIAENRDALAAVRTSVAVGPAGLGALQTRVDTYDGVRQGGRESASDRHAGITSTTAILLTALSLISIIVIVALATHGFTK